MHYDWENGAKDTSGLFSRVTVIVLSILVVLTGLYLLADWYAPEIIFLVRDHRATIENIVKTQPVNGDTDMIRIPSLGIEREIVPKNAEGKVQMSESNGKITLSGRSRSLGVTPFETKELSPFALLTRAKNDMRIYIDLNNERAAYQVTDVSKNTFPNNNVPDDLVIYALDDTGKIAITEIRAKKIGEVKI